MSRSNAFISASLSLRPARTLPWQAMVLHTCSMLAESAMASPDSASSSARSRTRPLNVGIAEDGRNLTDHHGTGPELLEDESRLLQFIAALREAAGRNLVELHHFGQQQHLACDALLGHLGLHALENETLVCGVLINDDDSIPGLGNDVSVVELGAGDAEGPRFDVFRGGCDCGWRMGA